MPGGELSRSRQGAQYEQGGGMVDLTAGAAEAASARYIRIKTTPPTSSVAPAIRTRLTG